MTNKRRTSFAGSASASLLVLHLSTLAFSYNYTGRVTLGSYLASEQLAQVSAGETSNNVATLSGRFYLRLTELTSNRFELVSDVRDKNDFFGLNDKQRLSLDNSNTFQARELYAKYPGRTFFSQVGRFAVPEAGAVYTDGALQGWHLTDAIRGAAFGGWNPKRPEQMYVQFNPDSRVYGLFLTYNPRRYRQTSLWADAAVVTDIVGGQTDRTYCYNSLVFQLNSQSRVRLLTYLDFVPHVYLQNGTLNVEQGLGPKLSVAVNAFLIDVIEYQRLQSVRERLPSSPYKEIGAKARYVIADGTSLELSYLAGHRDADGLGRTQTMLTADFLGAFNRHWDIALSVGYRNNFISYDTFTQARATYSSKEWELAIDEQYAYEQYNHGRALYHPLISDISYSILLDSSLYGTVSLQDVRDERAKIISFFFRLTYRFGSKETPPARDAAPPRGTL